MVTDQPIILKRDCAAVMVPSGEPLALHAGGKVWLTQALGGSYTVMTDHGYTVRIDGRDGDALGLSDGQSPKVVKRRRLRARCRSACGSNCAVVSIRKFPSISSIWD